jgi:hypothetical protein
MHAPNRHDMGVVSISTDFTPASSSPPQKGSRTSPLVRVDLLGERPLCPSTTNFK